MSIQKGNHEVIDISFLVFIGQEKEREKMRITIPNQKYHFTLDDSMSGVLFISHLGPIIIITDNKSLVTTISNEIRFSVF